MKMTILASSLALVFAALPSAASAQTAAKTPAETLLTISATGQSARAPDIATISAGVLTQASDARTAMQQNANNMTRVIAALKQAGISERDIQTANINLSPQFRYGDNKPPQLTGYQASNTVNVKLRKLDKSGDVLDALVSQGANQINGPQFGLDKPEAAEDEARIAAIKDARARANLYADATGLRVKRIVSISEGGQGYQPPYPMPMMHKSAEAADVSTPVSPGELRTLVSITVTFELE